MSVLESLNLYYERMKKRGETDAPGYSREKISFAIVLSDKGEPVSRIDCRQQIGSKLVPGFEEVPAAVRRTSAVQPNLFWDKTAYVLGRTAGDGRRMMEEHTAFKMYHLKLLAETEDTGLLAFRFFLEHWTLSRFDSAPFVADMLDTNLVFCLNGEPGFIHLRDAARLLVAAQSTSKALRAPCLISGITAPVQRLHPIIKGVEGAHPSGATLVSFNLDAFTSYGKEQGNNAPTSETAAFRYGVALNNMLNRASTNRLPQTIGGTTVLFWADISDAGESAAECVDEWFSLLFAQKILSRKKNRLDIDAGETDKIKKALSHISSGGDIKSLDPHLSEGVRFHVMGLSPNFSRLSVRFWISDYFEVFFKRLSEHYSDFIIEPRPWRGSLPDALSLLLKTTALQENPENIPPLLAGEVMRAILTGAPYPRSLLTTVLIRLRAGDDPATGWHAAAIRAVLARESRLKHRKDDPPVGLDRKNVSAAYQLGRMFALAEVTQRMALGKINTSIRDRYFGAASAAPATIYPLILRNMQNHLSELCIKGKGEWIQAEMEQIAGYLPPYLPRVLRLEEQGRFVIGYYHQRQATPENKLILDLNNEQV